MKGTRKKDTEQVEDIGLERRTEQMAKGRKAEQKNWNYSGYDCMAYVRPKTRSQTLSKIATKISWVD